MTVSQVLQFDNTITAGTAKATPMSFPMLLPALDVAWIEWRVPPGPRGTVGFWVGSHGAQIIPYASGGANWLVADNAFDHWDLEDQMDSGDWQMQGYNLGNFDHTITIRFGLALPPDTSPGGVVVPSIQVLNS